MGNIIRQKQLIPQNFRNTLRKYEVVYIHVQSDYIGCSAQDFVQAL